MLILSFDTCFNKTYLVLRKDNTILENEIISSTEKEYHSVFLIPKIRDVLKKNNLLIKDLSAISVNIGPGSFTGIRAGITIARVLCQQANIKLIGIPSMEILAKINSKENDTTVILDARKNKVYYAKYNKEICLVYPQLVDLENLESNIDKNSTIITDAKISEFLSSININAIKYEENDNNLGLYLSDISHLKIQNNNEDYNWAKVKPLYIQPPSITKPKEIKNV